ncbi:MAG TPA: class II aldolase/adducin family protein [Levilinea sp.]|nr:class II aldolase/adducin family protein [Levilinea sp.]
MDYSYTIRRSIVTINRRMIDQGFICSSDGNVSARIDENRILITPAGVYKLNVSPEMIVLVDNDGNVIESRMGYAPSSELPLHLEAYRRRPDAQAVIHAHPPYSLALTLAGLPFPADIMPEAAEGLCQVPVAHYAKPGTKEVAASIAGLIEEFDTVLLDHHGSITVGKTLDQALMTLERVEFVARVYHLAHAYGGVRPLPPREVDRLSELYYAKR